MTNYMQVALANESPEIKELWRVYEEALKRQRDAWLHIMIGKDSTNIQEFYSNYAVLADTADQAFMTFKKAKNF